MTTESFRKDVAKRLSELQTAEDDAAKVEFPASLTSSDRKYVHKIAESFRLPTKSQGVGAERFLTVYKTAPEGMEQKPERPSFVPVLKLSPEAMQKLSDAAAGAPPGTGRPTLAAVRPMSGRALAEPPAAKRQKVKPVEVGDEVEGFWPDEEAEEGGTWLPATVAEVKEDGSFNIVWTEDASSSDVPADYVRRIAGGSEPSNECTTTMLPAMDIGVMEKNLEARRQLPQYKALGEKRESLPGFKQRKDVIESINGSQVVLLNGETGCGKSTQVPQLILDACPEAKILCMQPRKLAATTLAERIAAERCQSLGQDVGYVVPFGAKGANCSLVFMTLGVFRKTLLTNPDLRGITHVIFDEVHERDKLADFNMIFMRDLLGRRPHDLRLVLMSATLQMETFEKYFEGHKKVAVPGRVFPVSELYMDEVAATLYKQPMFRSWLGPGILCGGIDIPAGAEGDWNEREWKKIVFQNTKPEDKEELWGLREKGLEEQMKAPMSKARLLDGLRKHDVLQQSSLAFDYPIIEALILHIDRMYKESSKGAKPGETKPAGTILVFLPGWGDIDQLKKRLTQSFDQERFKILPLHSQVSAAEQQEIFEPAKLGTRKIVLTTNIAEASITVEGTEFVIDSGRAKEVSYDPYLKVGTLTTSWISQASAKQRAGRAGRTQGGLCFHLFCRERFDKIDEFLAPELLRSPLEDSALTAKLMLMQMGSKEKVSSFLAKAPSPPEKIAIDNSIQLLVELGAFTGAEQLTALGEHLTRSPLPPRLAKTVLWSILLGCLDDALCVVSAAGGFVRDPFRTVGMSHDDARELKRKLAAPHNSDHACLLKAVTGYQDASNQQGFCDQWKLAIQTMRQIRDQQAKLYTELHENKSETFANRNRGNFRLLVAVLCAGIFPNIARRRGTSDFYEAQEGKVECKPHGSSAYQPEEPDEWVFFQELSQMESMFKLKLVTPVPSLALLLLGGEGQLTIDESKGKGGKGGGPMVTLLNGWVKFSTNAQVAQELQGLRSSLQTIFQAFCARPDHVPPAPSLAALDSVAELLTVGKDGAIPTNNGGAPKRHAPWQPAGDDQRYAPQQRFVAQPKGGGKWGGPKGGGKAFINPYGGGGGGVKGKGGKGWGGKW